MDASGRIDAAFVFGNNFWLGSKSSCARVTDPHPVRVDSRYARNTARNLTSVISPIPITYRMIYAKHFSPLQYDTKIYDKVSACGIVGQRKSVIFRLAPINCGLVKRQQVDTINEKHVASG